MNFFIRPTTKTTDQMISSAAGTKNFGNIDVEYTRGIFNKFCDDFLAGPGANLSQQVFEWRDHEKGTEMTGDKVLRRLANTIDSLYVRCCYDMSDFCGVQGELHSRLMPQILSRKNETGFPILKWDFKDEKLSILNSSLVRSMILNTDSIVECIYLFSFFPFKNLLPDTVDKYYPALMANVLKNSKDKTFTFNSDSPYKGFQKFYGNYSKWDGRHRNLRNYLSHMSDLHTVVYSELGKVTAAFCCAFNDVEPIEKDLRLISFEQVSESHQKILEYQLDCIKWYESVLGM